MHAKLFTRAKGFIADIEIPSFNPPPEGVMWGQRFFVLDESSMEPLLYTEGLLFYVPAGMPPTGVGAQPTHELRG